MSDSSRPLLQFLDEVRPLRWADANLEAINLRLLRMGPRSVWFDHRATGILRLYAFDPSQLVVLWNKDYLTLEDYFFVKYGLLVAIQEGQNYHLYPLEFIHVYDN